MQDNYQYIKAATIMHTPIIKLSNVADFENLIEKIKPENVFIVADLKLFAIFDNGLFYAIEGINYESLGELIEGLKKDFVDGKIYRDVTAKGFPNYQEFMLSNYLGYQTYNDFVASARGGFRNLDVFFVKQKIYEINPAFFEEIKELKKESDFFYYCKKNGICSYGDFCDRNKLGNIPPHRINANK